MRYAFWMSYADTFKSLSTAIVNEILKLSLERTDEEVNIAGLSVVCPPAIYLGLRRKFSPITMSKIK